jgi:succinate-acetate transporter protein
MAVAQVDSSSRVATKDIQAAPTPVDWGNSTPLCLFAFAAVTFMISMVNAGAVNGAAVPVVISVGLFFGGGTQLIGGFMQLRTGNTLDGVLFSTFGAFWIVLAAIMLWFSKLVPASQLGHAEGLLLYTFTMLAFIFLLLALRTSVATVLSLTLLTITLLLLAIGNYGGSGTVLNIAGVVGIVLAANAAYNGAAGIAAESYGRPVLPVGVLSKR